MTDEITAGVTAIHIHEDDWGMRRLHPLAAAVEAADEIRTAEAASEANRAPDGAGWTDLHIIQPPEHDYPGVGLTFAQAEAVLTPILPRVRRFTSTTTPSIQDAPSTQRDPWGSYEDDAHCYGVDATCFIKLDGDDGLVRQIWFQADTDNAVDLEALLKAIVALDGIVPSIIADYWFNCTGAVGDRAFLERYMRLLIDPDDGDAGLT